MVSQGSERKKPVIRRKHGEKWVVQDVASGRKTVFTLRSHGATFEAEPDPGMIVVREELLDGGDDARA